MQASNSFYPPASYFPFPMFFHPAMFNQHHDFFTNSLSQIQQTNNSTSPPSIHEFFENLEKTYGEYNFNEAKSKFLQEEIDVLDIFSLKDYDWERLGIKLGIKSKIIREVEKYR